MSDRCPQCGSEFALILFSSAECINSECELYSEKLFIEVAERESEKFELDAEFVTGLFNFAFGD